MGLHDSSGQEADERGGDWVRAEHPAHHPAQHVLQGRILGDGNDPSELGNTEVKNSCRKNWILKDLSLKDFKILEFWNLSSPFFMTTDCKVYSCNILVTCNYSVSVVSKKIVCFTYLLLYWYFPDLRTTLNNKYKILLKCKIEHRIKITVFY